jgi:hypothetical protein
MKRSKQASILATMVVTGLLGIGVFGSSSASADVLCSTYTGWPYCPTGSQYGVGKEFAAPSQVGSTTMKVGSSGSLGVMASCGTGSLNMTVTNAGGNGYLALPKVDTTSLAFGSCGNDSLSVVNDGTADIKLASESKATLEGLFIPIGLQIKVRTNYMYEEFEYGSNVYGECTYEIVGGGLIAGPKTREGLTYTLLEFNEAQANRLSGEGPGCGNAKARLTAKFKFDPNTGNIYLTTK